MSLMIFPFRLQKFVFLDFGFQTIVLQEMLQHHGLHLPDLVGPKLWVQILQRLLQVQRKLQWFHLYLQCREMDAESRRRHHHQRRLLCGGTLIAVGLNSVQENPPESANGAFMVCGESAEGRARMNLALGQDGRAAKKWELG